MNLNDYWTNAFWSVIPTIAVVAAFWFCLLYTSPSPRDS